MDDPSPRLADDPCFDDPRFDDPHTDDPHTDGSHTNVFGRILRVLAEIVVVLYLVLDGIVSPLFGPLVRALSRLRLVRRLERAIASLNPYVILALLVVPFAFAELAKVYGLILIADGHYRIGMTMFLGAYVVSILVCERIFHAGKAPLMTIGWFKTLYDWLMMIRDHVLTWFRRTRVWQAMMELKRSMRAGWQRFGGRLRAMFGRRPKGALERP